MPDGTTTVEMSPAVMIEKFIALRDKIADIKDAHKRQLAPYNQALETLEAKLLAALDQAGLAQMKGEAGTVYKSTRTSASVKDWGATLAFIREHEAWDLLEARVSKTAVGAVIEETGQPVPGVNVTTEVVLHVRRS